MSLANVEDPDERDRLFQAIEDSYKNYDDPMLREHQKLIVERGYAVTLLKDLLNLILINVGAFLLVAPTYSLRRGERTPFPAAVVAGLHGDTV